MADLTEKHHKPLIGFTFQSLENSFIEKLLDHGMAVLPSPERAARATKLVGAFRAMLCPLAFIASPA